MQPLVRVADHWDAADVFQNMGGVPFKLAALLIALYAMSSAPSGGALRPSVLGDIGPVLAASGDQFTLDGKPQFLLMLSYFDGLRTMEKAPGRVVSDLAYIKDKVRAHGIRVLANWCDYRETATPICSLAADTLIQADGSLRPASLEALGALLEAAAGRGLVIDLTLTKDGIRHPVTGDNDAAQFAAYRDAIKKLVGHASIRPYRNVLIDVQNELLCHSDLSVDQALEIRQAIHDIDPARLVTVGGVCWEAPAPDSGPAKIGRLAGRRAEFAGKPGFSVVALHNDRDPPGETAWSDHLIVEAREIKRGLTPARVPIYFQEPPAFTFPRFARDNDDGDLERWRQAIRNAKAAGVAAFTLHSRAAFDMSADSFETQVSDARYRFHNPNLKQILEGPRSLRDVVDGR